MSRRFVFFGGLAQPLLNQFPGAAYAYSMRLLNSAYTGDCIRIRRSSDNAELDIPFSGQYIDEAALVAFVGANSAYVVTWYDQSGNGVNKTQPSASNQPLIVSSGTIYKINSFIGCYTSSTTRDGGLYNNVTGGGVTSQAYNVMNILNNEECLPATNTYSSPTRFYGVMQPNGSAPTVLSGSPTYYKNGVLTTSTTRQNLYDAFEDTFSVLTTLNVDLSAWTQSSNVYPGYRGIRGHNLEEIVYFSTTNDRALIEANIIDYYGL